ncbi:Ig-like domain-containing protein [Pleionea sediminis]|uniref:Ig-like domain-containing protein n=1 Tax=Pleionea sediminis TaxID=2569479 RepID=UPI0011868872|nr:Ig-like domain-containing protein [Pleionea sediminis]
MKYIIALLAAVCVSSVFAGATHQLSVYVKDNVASGSLTGARNSSDQMQYIGCATVATADSNHGICAARNSAGVSVYCILTQPYQVEQVRSVNSASHIYFRKNERGLCEYIQLSNRSLYIE